MLALLASLAGFFTSFIPELLNFVKDKGDKNHELEIIKLQVEAGKSKSFSKLEEVKIHADNVENKIIYNHAKPAGIKWVDALSASVRPFITYSFLLLYLGVKVTILFNHEVGISMPIWTDEDTGMFCAVLGFWFGNRSFLKVRHV
jgi:hypothetical protein